MQTVMEILADKLTYLTVDQVAFDKHMQRSLALALEAEWSKEEIDQLRREWKGGSCPTCGRVYWRRYVKAETNAGKSNYAYYTADCTCDTPIEKKAKEREARARLELAGVPLIYRDVRLDTWDGTVDRRTNEAYDIVRQYIAGREYHKGHGHILFGPVGTGKTRCAVCILRVLLTEGKIARFVPMGEALDIMTDRRESRYGAMQRLLDYDAVLFDDMDKVAAEQDFVQEKIYRLFDRMVSRRKIIIGTANFRESADFRKKFDEATVSRLMKGCRFTRFEGSDYRMRERKR